MRFLYKVYVDAGIRIIKGKEFKVKKNYDQFLDKAEAMKYKEKLENDFINVIIEEHKMKSVTI